MRRLSRRGGIHSGDVFDLTASAIGMYSVSRRLDPAYSASLIRIRRSLDNNELDVGFDGVGNLDTAAILAFTGTGPTDQAWITTVYSQNLFQPNLVQATFSLQPGIVDVGAILTSSTGKPCARFDGSMGLQTTNFTGLLAQPNTLWWVGSLDTWVIARGIMDGNDLTNRNALITAGVTPRIDQFAGSSVNANTGLSIGTAAIVSAGFNGASSFTRVDNNAKVTGGNPGAAGIDGLTVGANAILGAGTIQSFHEAFVINTVSTPDEDGRLDNINAYYGIY